MSHSRLLPKLIDTPLWIGTTRWYVLFFYPLCVLLRFCWRISIPGSFTCLWLHRRHCINRREQCSFSLSPQLEITRVVDSGRASTKVVHHHGYLCWLEQKQNGTMKCIMVGGSWVFQDVWIHFFCLWTYKKHVRSHVQFTEVEVRKASNLHHDGATY